MAGYIRQEKTTIIHVDSYSLSRCPNSPLVAIVESGTTFKRFEFRNFQNYDGSIANFPELNSGKYWVIPNTDSGLYAFTYAVDNSQGGNDMAAVNVVSGQTVYIVGSSTGQGNVSFAATPKQHVLMSDAKAEASRLANAAGANRSTTKCYLVFQLVARADVANSAPVGF